MIPHMRLQNFKFVAVVRYYCTCNDAINHSTEHATTSIVSSSFAREQATECQHCLQHLSAPLPGKMEELKEALRTYRESLAELDSIRSTSQSVADSQEVCIATGL